ncbi:MAG TPA: DUF4388 domain-containing protein [Nitrospiria bacterium]
MTQDIPDSGRIHDHALPKVLTSLQRRKKTGVLTIHRNDQHKTLYFNDGDVVFAGSKYQDDWLGEFLLKRGRITLRQYDVVSEVVRSTRKRFGAVLVEQGWITPKDLFVEVRLQVKDIILSLFSWINGEFTFTEGALPGDEVITLKMSMPNLILEGIRRIQDFTRLRNELPPLNNVIQITTDPLILFQDIDLTDDDRKTVALIDGKNSIAQIFEQAGPPVFETLKLVHALLAIGMAEIGVADLEPKPGPRAASPSASPAGSAATQDIASRMIKEVLRGRKEEVQEGREAVITEPDAHLSMTRQKIQEAYDGLEGQDFYQVLGIAAESGREQIKRAYFRLAKEYHPDRHFQAEMEDLTPQLEELFRRITEAYDTLFSEAKRKEYDVGRTVKKFGADRGGQPAPGRGAADLFSKGEQAVQRGDINAAVYYFEAAVKAQPDKGAYHVQLARALMKVSGRQRDAEKHFKRAIELEPATVENYISLGQLYKRDGMTQRARRQFEEALLWDPDNAAVKAELKNFKT